MASIPGLWFDWDGSGFATSVNGDCTALLMNARYQRGGTPEITGAAQAGGATFILQNPDGLFDPDNTESPLYGLLRDGVPVWFGINEDGTITGTSAPTRGRFAGRTLSISPIPQAGAGDSTPTAEIVCEDALGWYSRVFVALGDDCSPGPSPSAEPIHAWTACEPTGPAIDFIAGEDGTYTDIDMTRGVDGPPAIADSGGVELTTADGHITIDDAGAGFPVGNSDRTWEWWFKFTAAFLGDCHVVVYGGLEGTFGIDLASGSGEDTPTISVRGTPNAAALTGLINPNAQDGDWHYAAVTYRGATRTVVVYQDGVIQWAGTFGLELGTDVGDTALIAQGIFGSIYQQSSTAVYDRVLAEGEVIQHAAGVYPFEWPGCS